MSKKWELKFEISERKVLLRVLDVLSVLTFIYVLSNFFEFYYFKIAEDNYFSLVILAAYLLLFGSIFNLYRLQEAVNFLKTIRNIFFTTVATILIYLLTPVFAPSLPDNRLQIIYLFLSMFIGLLLWRSIYISFFTNYNFSNKIILICNKDDFETLKSDLEAASPHIEVSQAYFINDANIAYDYQLDFKNLMYTKKKSNHEFVVACPNSSPITIELNNLLIKLIEKGYSVREYTHVFEDLSYRVPVHMVEKDFYKYFPFSRNNSNQLYQFFNRLLDIIVAFIGIILFIPFLIMVYLLNFIGNKGSLFYTQTRVGKFGKNFKIYKLRTMVSNAEKDGAMFAQKNDVRVTPFGKYLRQIRFDEIPQLINVLKNEMSIIGPRPERPEFVKQLNDLMPFYETRHMIKPGLTGWAQVNYNYGTTFDESLIKLQYDLYYIKNRNIFLDASILLKTLSTVIFMKGQ